MILLEMGISVLLTRAPERCETGKTAIRIDSIPDNVLFTADWSAAPNIMIGADLETALAIDLSLVSEVQHVLVERADGNLLVWVVLDNPSREVREKVFLKEMGLIEGFPEIDFDFNVVPAMGRHSHEIAAGAKVVYSRKDNDIAKQG